MEIENENQDQPVIVEETAAECIERLKHELARAEDKAAMRMQEVLRMRATANSIDDSFHRVLDFLGGDEWIIKKVQDNFDFIDRQQIRDLIDERIDEAKEEGQEIAKEKIQEMIEETLNNATFDTSIYL